MRRALVITDESARHPFRMGLPPHVRREAASIPPRGKWRIDTQDMKEFLLAYCACFVCVSAFIG